jgi:hypothetical protein
MHLKLKKATSIMLVVLMVMGGLLGVIAIGEGKTYADAVASQEEMV